MKESKISVIIPAYNEEGNVKDLILRLNKSLTEARIDYELIFINDHSTDNTRKEIKKFTEQYPVKMFLKVGKKGKAFSLIQGFKKAKYDIIGMIDADLQYPPEAIPEMMEKLNNSDIVVSNRIDRSDSSWKRKIASKTFRFIFVRFLFNLDCDAQSGLKVFKKEILDYAHVAPTPWTFDLQFLYKAQNVGYTIKNFDIEFAERQSEQVKLKFLSSIFEIGTQAFKLRIKPLCPVCFIDKTRSRMKGNGMYYNGNKFITHTDLHYKHSAIQTFHLRQKIVIILLGGGVVLGVILNWRETIIIIVSLLSFLYLADLLFSFFLTIKTLKKSSEIVISKDEINSLDDNELPIYTIFCPLYKEWQVIPEFVKSISKLDWPKNRLDVQLLLEEDDKKTIFEVKKMKLPKFFRVIIVPDSEPKTKPKACNYGLNHAKGSYAVIYDAEDNPAQDQLKKAFIVFQKLKNEKIICVQSKLNFYNSRQNILTRLFAMEYSLWFDLILPGLQSVKAPIPLGGTSNHFETKNLHLLQGWDPFNVTEDCDLGMRIAKKGYYTAIIDSTTTEEANSQVGNWFRQRSRWIKGYMQTYLVHMRRPGEFITDLKNPDIIFFQLTVGGKIISLFINPFMWAMTIIYFVFRDTLGLIVESFYLTPIFYIAVFSLVFGNFFYIYNYMIGSAKREQWDIIKYTFLVPLYWLMISMAAWKALIQLIYKPHYWEKTVHGLHLKNK